MINRAVAPRVGAWIEIDARRWFYVLPMRVAPRVGAWIEIQCPGK